MQVSPTIRTRAKEKIILGIDPGTNVMGFGVLKVSGPRMEILEIGVLRMEKMKDPAIKLKHIFEETIKIIDTHCPDELAIEAPFFGKNVQSMLKLGRAQGVAIAAALSRGLPISEYSPRKIKLSVTGSGNSSKEQVAAMLQQLFSIANLPKFLDATDALAVALCHHFQNGNGNSISKKAGGWKSFLNENPGRLAENAVMKKRK
ncbi:MAG TPA: crossover junction endodeoxyribonuclease RuvC [Bacteroidia bacterium]|nr:crossover junction endodeoxyribonuclease RuvC [Bacteroidia bacterium]